jgi:cytoskeleton protein RodZ
MTEHESSPQSRPGSSDGAPDPSLGGLLRQARDARGLSIEELAGELRIEAKHLLALEENRFRAIGAPVFAKGYLKQYGQRLGLETQSLLAAYAAQAQGQEIAALPKHSIQRGEELPAGLWFAALAALVVLVGLFMYWTLGVPPTDQSPSVVGAAADAPDARAATPLRGDLEPDPGASVELPLAVSLPATDPVRAASETDAPGELDVRERTVPAGPEFLPTEPAPENGEASAVGGAVPDALAAAVPSPPSASPDFSPGALQFELRFVEDCWTEVYDAGGARIYYGLGLAGTRAELAANPPIDVLLGNAGAVSMLVDGVPFTIPRTSRQGNLARFTVSSSE